MKMVLNELSCDSFPFDNINRGRELIKNFLVLYKKGTKFGLSYSLILDRDFDNIILADQYPVAKWRNDENVGREIKRVYKRMFDKAEFISNYLSEKHKLREFVCKKGSSKGLLIANELNFVVLSFLSDSFWDTKIIKGTYKTLKPSGNLSKVSTSVYNVSRENHFDNIKSWI
jgi:hypothetical protein